MQLYNDYALAERLHTSVAEIRAMSNEDYEGWLAWFIVKKAEGEARGNY